MEVLGETVCYFMGCAHELEDIDRDLWAEYDDCRRAKSGPIDCWHVAEFDGEPFEFSDCSEPAKKHFRDFDYCW